MIHQKAPFNLNIQNVLNFEDNEIILFDDSKIVNLKSDVTVPSYRNICCRQNDGTIKWWIQDYADYLKNKTPGLSDKEIELVWKFRSYTSVWEEGGKLKAFNSQGLTCTIDPTSGQMLEIEWER